MSSAWVLGGLCEPGGSPLVDLWDGAGEMKTLWREKGGPRAPLCPRTMRAARGPSHWIPSPPRAVLPARASSGANGTGQGNVLEIATSDKRGSLQTVAPTPQTQLWVDGTSDGELLHAEVFWGAPGPLHTLRPYAAWKRRDSPPGTVFDASVPDEPKTRALDTKPPLTGSDVAKATLPAE